MHNPPEDRRRHPRIEGDGLPLLLQGEQTEPLRVRDISLSGIAFFSEAPVPVMTRVAFILEFPKQNSEPSRLEGSGVVVRCERLASALGHFEVALFFQDLPQNTQQQLRDFLAERDETNTEET